MTDTDEFIEALRADVVIEDVAPRRPLTALEALAVGRWWDEERNVHL